jgi:hypothetical protein
MAVASIVLNFDSWGENIRGCSQTIQRLQDARQNVAFIECYQKNRFLGGI